MTAMRSVLCGLAALAILVSGSRADNITWANSAGNTDWQAGASWSGSGVPGASDVAVFPDVPKLAHPSLSGATNINAMRIPSTHQEGAWNINGAGTLTIQGSPGTSGYGIYATLGWTGQPWWYNLNTTITPNLVLGGPQTWFGSANRGLVLNGTLGGTGPLTIGGDNWMGQTTYGSKFLITYQGPSDPNFSGGLIVSNTVVYRDLTGQSADRNVGFGAGNITLKGIPGYDNSPMLSRQDGEFHFLTANTAASLVTLTLTNGLVVDPTGGHLYSWQKGTSPYTRNVFGGPFNLGGPLRMSLRAPAAASSTRFTGPMTVNAAAAGTPGLFPGHDALYLYRDYWGQLTKVPLDLDGTIADGVGSFRNPLIFRSRMGNDATINGAANSYAGGTVVEHCDSSGYAHSRSALSVGAGGVLGAGDALVLPGGRLRLAAAANLASGKKVRVESTDTAHGVVAVRYNGVPALDASSDGVLALDTSSFTTALDQSALGNGKMFLGTFGWNACGVTSLQPGSDRVYRLGGGWDKTYDAPYLETSTSLALGDVGGVCSLQVGKAAWNGGGTVWLKGNNTFSGDLTVSGPFDHAWMDGATLIGNARTTAGQSPFGAATGNVYLQHGKLYLNGQNSGQKVNKNRLTFEGVSFVVEQCQNAWPTYIEFDSLVRTNRGALVFNSMRNRAQDLDRLTVTNGAPPMVNGIVAPYFIAFDEVNWVNNFSTYNAVTGFGKFAAYVTMPSPGTGAEVVDYNGAVAGTPSIWALRANGAISGAGPIAINGGGLLTTGGFTIAPAIDFGTAEGVVFSAANHFNPTVLSGKVSGSGGLSVLGGAVSLKNTNNDFTGQITVSGHADTSGGAFLMLDNATDGNISALLGNADNDILLNGGMLYCYANWMGMTLPATRTITLGPLGGMLITGRNWDSALTINGNITGPGSLNLFHTWAGVANIVLNSATANDYAGGTRVNGTLTVNANSSLGTGDVLMDFGKLYLKGNANIGTTARLYASLDTRVFFQSAAPAVGSLTGAGKVALGATGVDTTLTVGGDGTDCAFYGTICQFTGRTGSVAKSGSGTWTLHGQQLYTGTTTVTAGRLKLAGSLAGGLTVGSGGGLTVDIGPDGATYGSVAGAVVLDGTLTVNLADGYAPDTGESWTILGGASGYTGSFDGISAPGLKVAPSGGDLVLSRVATGTAIMLR